MNSYTIHHNIYPQINLKLHPMYVLFGTIFKSPSVNKLHSIEGFSSVYLRVNSSYFDLLFSGFWQYVEQLFSYLNFDP